MSFLISRNHSRLYDEIAQCNSRELLLGRFFVLFPLYHRDEEDHQIMSAVMKIKEKLEGNKKHGSFYSYNNSEFDEIHKFFEKCFDVMTCERHFDLNSVKIPVIESMKSAKLAKGLRFPTWIELKKLLNRLARMSPLYKAMALKKKKREMIGMSLHPRVGQESPLNVLYFDMVEEICKYL